MSVVDEYLDDLTPGNREELEYIRRLVNQTVPDAEEVITYGMPGFKYKGKYLIAYGAFKDHCSLFPGAEPAETVQRHHSVYCRPPPSRRAYQTNAS
jgi:uncharacterized protein YdhG (YjbR/CyaY superfamily)